MATFTFDPPERFGPSAGYRQKRLLCWLRDRLAARGVEASGPLVDASGWLLAVNAECGLVTIRLGRDGGAKSATAIVAKLGEADAEYEDTVAAFEDIFSGGRAVAQVEYV